MSNNKFKHSSKLKNVQAIREMLDGSHKTQTRKVYSFDGESDDLREVGDIWIDKEGKRWEQKNGYKIRSSNNLSYINELRKELKTRKICPRCGEKMTKRLDEKFYILNGVCMDCTIKEEHQMRVDGTWEEYEKNRVKTNIDAFLDELEVQKEEMKKEFSKQSVEFINSDGTLEKWDNNYTPEQIQKAIDEYFSFLRERLYVSCGVKEKQVE